MWGWAKEHENSSRNHSNALENVGMDWKMWGGTRRHGDGLVNVAWGVPNIVSRNNSNKRMETARNW